MSNTIFATGGIAGQRILLLGLPDIIAETIEEELAGSGAQLEIRTADEAEVLSADAQQLLILQPGEEPEWAALTQLVVRAEEEGFTQELGRVVLLVRGEASAERATELLEDLSVDYTVVAYPGIDESLDAAGLRFDDYVDDESEPIAAADLADFLVRFIAQPSAFSRELVALS